MGNTTHQVLSLVTGAVAFSRSEFEKLKRTSSEMVFAIGAIGSSTQIKPVQHVSAALVSLSVIVPELPGADESMTITLKRVRAGVKVTLLAATITLDDETVLAAGELDLTDSLAVVAVELKESDYVECVMTYTAGATPTPMTQVCFRAQLGAFS